LFLLLLQHAGFASSAAATPVDRQLAGNETLHQLLKQQGAR
jgi:hypothetical protein